MHNNIVSQHQKTIIEIKPNEKTMASMQIEYCNIELQTECMFLAR